MELVRTYVLRVVFVLENAMKYAAICPWCGNEWAYFEKKPVAGEAFDVGGVKLPDGETPKAGSLLKCQHCNNQIFKLTVTSIVEVR